MIFRQLDTSNQEELASFNELMDDLSVRGSDLEKVKRIIERYNERKDAYLLVCIHASGKVIGSLLGVLVEDYCDDCRPILFVENVVTHHDYQRQGIGKMMFEEIEKWAKQYHTNYEVLCSGMQRKEAHQFYQAIDFKEVKGFKKYL